MLEWLNSIFDKLKDFSSWTAEQRNNFISITLIVGSILTTVYFYQKHERDFKELKKELNSKNIIIEANKVEKDSLLIVIYEIKLLTLQKELDKSDSLLKESSKIRKSLNPVINDINTKINEVNN